MYRELTFFIDETGLLANLDAIDPRTQKKDCCLVGGVVCWGNYDELDASLAEILKESLATHYDANAWDELHYHNSQGTEPLGSPKYWEKKNAFIASVRDKLQRSPFAGRIQGVSIEHKSDLDISPNENEEDNRYLFMLQSLIERAVFSDDAARRLTKDAKITVRAASRKLVLNAEDARVPKIQARLDRMRRDYYYDKKNQFTVPYFHDENDVRNATTAFLKYRRSDSTYRFDEQRVERINYERFDNNNRYKDLSASGYYLADLFLGQKSYVLSRRDQTSAVESFVVPEFKAWTYEPVSEELARCDADLAQSGGYFDYLLWSKPDVVSNPIFAKFKSKFAQILCEQDLQRCLQRDWDRLRFAVDNPRPRAFTQARETFVNVDEITRRFEEGRKTNVDAETAASRVWVRFAVANHSGDVAEGERVWQEIATNSEPLYRRLSPEKELEFRTEIGLRRAVNLLDSFRFDEARRVVDDLIERQEEAFRFFQSSKFFKNRTKRAILGRCYSQSGQIDACLGKLESARQKFERAAAQYDAKTDAGDLDRNAIYLGHVACDMRRFAVGDCGKALWEKTLANLPTTQNAPPNKRLSLKDLNDNNKYWAPLLLKGVCLFGTDDDVADRLEDWNKSPLKTSIFQRLKAKQSEWPDGIILQSVAVLNARLQRILRAQKYVDETRGAFDDAISALQKEDSPLMNFLAAVARLRKAVWLADAGQPDATDELQAGLESAVKFENLPRDIASIAQKSIAAKTYFGARANETLKQAARQIVDVVRFNYY